jgi:NAD(P)-dependent dehydrogenase (short-subunit alcohol dehydrogenase family)
MRDLKGKVAFITGGSSGIGLGIAHALLDAGMRVAIGSRNPDRLHRALQDLGDREGCVHGITVDVTDRSEMARAAEEVQRVFGKVHLLCNNAGAGTIVPVCTATYNDWDWAIGVNLGGVINGLRTFLPRILAHGEGGHIVSTSSMSGLFIGGTAGVYSTTKYAVVGMMESLRGELAPRGVGVSVYCPGVVSTNFHESEDGRPAQFAEQNRAVSAETKAMIKTNFMEKGMDARDAGERVLRGILRNDLYILTHPEFKAGLRERFDAILASMPPQDRIEPTERITVERELGLLSHPVFSSERTRLLQDEHAV